MRLKFHSLMASPDMTCLPGKVYEIEDGRAAALIKGGYAVEVSAEPEPQAAPETTQAPAGEVETAEGEHAKPTTWKGKRRGKKL